MERIMIIGSSGSGKTSLSKELGAILNISPSHLDEYLWERNWQILDYTKWQGIVDELTAANHWIIDGNYCKAVSTRIILSDTIVMLDFSRWHCLFRIILRYFRYRNRSRPGMHPGCLERWNWSYMLSVYNFKRKIRPILLRTIEQHEAQKKLIVLKTREDVKCFVREVRHIAGIMSKS